ncbi:phospholipase [Coraliomargarita sinensis]|uniref:phospholipase D n=1 Tax=Coraliomargarita sinensis TaxID=2174842 RepID=A0A317ZJ41_9BACT|nr:phospholipase D-like domain-containing protein [Coraliomargarita sinensis]PXA05744.1 phospholipase [Coraliomargarita sinensis]
MKVILLLLIGAVLGISLLPYLLFRQKEMPPGTNLASPAYSFDSAELLIDRTAWDEQTEQYLREHQIFDTILKEVQAAETFIIADFFLWNPWKGAIEAGGSLRPLAEELATALIEKRIQNPDMPILVITDPINRIYGELAPDFYQRIADAGIPIVFTALDQLPDSSRLYAPQAWFWSRFLPSEKKDDARWVPNPFNPEGKKLTLAQLGRLLYFKANHRKVLVTGRSGGETRLLVPSFNPADGSANHSNIGVLVDGPVARFAAESELEVAAWSGAEADHIQGGLTMKAAEAISGIQNYLSVMPGPDFARLGEPAVAYRSEGAIRDEIILQLQKAVAGTRIDIGMFYFSDRKVIQALKSAIKRGAKLRVLLDANRDAFGREKNGIPNRIIAAELMELTEDHELQVRWAATHGEQFHSKVLRISGPQQEVLFLGSANWTRRNIGNLNLESNLLLTNVATANQSFDAYFESVWGNERGYAESLPYEDLAESGFSLTWKKWLYRFQEWSGASTF